MPELSLAATDPREVTGLEWPSGRIGPMVSAHASIWWPGRQCGPKGSVKRMDRNGVTLCGLSPPG